MTFLRQDFHIFNRYRRFSSIRRVRSLRNHKAFYTFFWGVIGGGLVGFLCLPWQQNITGSGRVLAYSPNERRQEISAPTDGRVEKWNVLEGEKVKKGEPIVELADNDPEILNRLRLEKEAVQRRLDAAIMALETAKKNVERQASLLQKGLSAPLALENARLNLNRYLVDEANAAAELARVEIKLSRQLTQLVVSPIDGTILKVVAGQGGQLVKQGDLLAVLIPDTDFRAVEIWVDGNDMPLLSKGREARIQFEGWPALQFSGWPSVAVGTFGGEVGFIDASDDGQGKFRIMIFQKENEPWPEPKYLRQGVRAKGWVLLDEVSVGYELWRIFNGFPPSLRRYEGQEYQTENIKKDKNEKK